MECWAAILGDCSGGMSGEHYISKGIFDGDAVTAFGLSWCKSAPKQIPLGTATANILCSHHNQSLATFDAEASRLSRFLSEQIRDLPLESADLRIIGPDLEKWALKTFVNLGYLGALDQVGGIRIKPDDFVVRHIFQNAPLPRGVGLYSISGGLSNTDFEVSVSWNGIRNLSAGGTIAAMTFTLNEVRFVINALPGEAEERLREIGTVNDVDYSRAEITYRPTNIVLRSATAGEKIINIDW